MYNYKETKEYLLYLKPKGSLLEIMVSIIILAFLIFTCFIKTYDITYTKGIIKDKELYVITEPTLTNKILKTNFFIIDNKKYLFKVKEISDVMYDEKYNNYQEIKLNSKFNYSNLILDIKLYQNKEILIKKIYKLII